MLEPFVGRVWSIWEVARAKLRDKGVACLQVITQFKTNETQHQTLAWMNRLKASESQ